MPKYQVTSPDGQKFEVNAPNGATQDQVLAFAQSQFKNQGSSTQDQSGYAYKALDIGARRASNAAAGVNYGMIPGTLGVPVDTVANVIDLAKAGIGSLYGGVTGKTPPEALEPMDRSKTFGTSQWIANQIRKLPYGTNFIDNQNPNDEASRLMYSGGAAAGGALMSGSALGAPVSPSQIPTAVASGAASQYAADKFPDDPAIAATAGMLPIAASNIAGDAARSKIANLQAEKLRNMERDETLKRAMDAGYQIPPSTVNPSATNRVLESIAGKVATQQAVSSKNTQVTDALARKATGLPENVPLTEEAMQSVRKDAYNQGYKPVEQLGQISSGRLYRDDLNKIEQQYQGAARSFPGAVRNDVSEMLAPLRRRSFDAGDALKMTQILRDEASKSFTSGDAALGKAQRAAATAIEDQIERGIPAAQNPDLVKNFREARQLMAKTHTVEDAIRSGSGSVDPNAIARELQKGAPLSGDLETIGRFANTFKKANQTPQVVGSQGVSKSAALASALMGGGGAVAGGPVGGVIGAAAPFVVPPAAQALILSKRYQAMQQPDYKASMLARMLAASPEMDYQALLQQPQNIQGRQ